MAGSEQTNTQISRLKVLTRLASCLFFAVVMLAANSQAGVGGSLSGTVKDAGGAVVADATVTAINIDTGVQGQIVTNGSGFYSFPDLPVGRYTILIRKTGFKVCQRTAIPIEHKQYIHDRRRACCGERFRSSHGDRYRRARGNIGHPNG